MSSRRKLRYGRSRNCVHTCNYFPEATAVPPAKFRRRGSGENGCRRYFLSKRETAQADEDYPKSCRDIGLVRLVDLGPRVFTRCRKLPETGYSLVAELTSGNAKRRDSLRFHPYGFTVGWYSRQFLGFSAAKTRAFGCKEKLRGSVAFAPGIT